MGNRPLRRALELATRDCGVFSRYFSMSHGAPRVQHHAPVNAHKHAASNYIFSLSEEPNR